MENEYIYWIAISHLPRWTQERINNLVIDILKNKQMTLQDFFELDDRIIVETFALNEKEINDIKAVRVKLPNIAFQVEKLLNKDIKILPLNSEFYPKIMKENLKVKYSPTIIYAKGDVKILQGNSIAIVGSRDAKEEALKFTDNISKKMAQEHKVIVSGFARGVDRQALDSSIKYNGSSIIVLPQGILTFDSGFKKYQKEIDNAKIIVLSTFPPDAGWSTGLAMARNRYIYGLAKEIYVAQTSRSGGTWNGAIDGLKKKRNVYVYYPEHDEKSASFDLLKQGAKAVNFNGQFIDVLLLYKETQLKMF